MNSPHFYPNGEQHILLNKPLYRFFDKLEIGAGMAVMSTWFYSVYVLYTHNSHPMEGISWLFISSMLFTFFHREKERVYSNEKTWSEKAYEALTEPFQVFRKKPKASALPQDADLDAAIILAYIQGQDFGDKEKEMIQEIIAKNAKLKYSSSPYDTIPKAIPLSRAHEDLNSLTTRQESTYKNTGYKKYLYQK